MCAELHPELVGLSSSLPADASGILIEGANAVEGDAAALCEAEAPQAFGAGLGDAAATATRSCVVATAFFTAVGTGTALFLCVSETGKGVLTGTEGALGVAGTTLVSTTFVSATTLVSITTSVKTGPAALATTGVLAVSSPISICRRRRRGEPRPLTQRALGVLGAAAGCGLLGSVLVCRWESEAGTRLSWAALPTAALAAAALTTSALFRFAAEARSATSAAFASLPSPNHSSEDTSRVFLPYFLARPHRPADFRLASVLAACSANEMPLSSRSRRPFQKATR